MKYPWEHMYLFEDLTNLIATGNDIPVNLKH